MGCEEFSTPSLIVGLSTSTSSVSAVPDTGGVVAAGVVAAGVGAGCFTLSAAGLLQLSQHP